MRAGRGRADQDEQAKAEQAKTSWTGRAGQEAEQAKAELDKAAEQAKAELDKATEQVKAEQIKADAELAAAVIEEQTGHRPAGNRGRAREISGRKGRARERLQA